jgi:hypothetical protein
VDTLEAENGWNELESSLDRLDKASAKRSITMSFVRYASVAACLTVFLSLGFYAMTRTSKSADLLSYIDNSYISVDSINEISLFLENGLTLKVANNANIRYDNNKIILDGDNSLVIECPNVNSDSKPNHLVVPKGKSANLTLSDGTKMKVNSGSHIVYPTSFKDEQRIIGVSGEVFLDVAHNADSPFVVKTEEMDVKVLGTVFDLSAYKDQSPFVVLVNGKVEVSSSESRAVISPSQRAKLNGKELVTDVVDVKDYIWWSENILYLNNKSLRDISSDLSDYYGVTIDCDRKIEDYRLSGKLTLSESIEEVFQIIKELFPCDVTPLGDGGYYMHE